MLDVGALVAAAALLPVLARAESGWGLLPPWLELWDPERVLETLHNPLFAIRYVAPPEFIAVAVILLKVFEVYVSTESFEKAAVSVPVASMEALLFLAAVYQETIAGALLALAPLLIVEIASWLLYR